MDRTVPVMEADAFRLTQVLFNIIGNALKFTSEGTVTIDCWTEKAPKDMARLLKALDFTMERQHPQMLQHL